MSIIITADIHNGYPGRLKDTIWSMDIITKYAHKNKINTIIVAGDLFHDRVNLNIDVANKVYDQLESSSKNYKQNWWCFPGNHDMFLKNSWDVNSLHILKDVINIVEKTQIINAGGITFQVIPFIHHEAEYMKLLSEIEEESKAEILITHIGVKNATLNECFLLKNWSVVEFNNSKFKYIFTGHFHCHQQVGKVVYPGSPIPFRFDEGVVDHGFLVFDGKKFEFIKIFDICSEFSEYRPPDFVTIIDRDLAKNISWVKDNYVRIILSKDYTIHERNKLQKILREKGALKVSFMLPKKEITEAKIISNNKHIGTPEALFNAYLEVDKPDLDQKTLKSMLKVIAKEAEERMVVSEESTDAQITDQ